MAETKFNLSTISKLFTEQTLVEILRKGLGREDAELESWEVPGGAAGAGDSYLSTVIKMKVKAKPVEGKNNQVDLVIKSLPQNLGRRKTFRSTDFFRNEINFYDKVATVFEEFQNSKTGIKNPLTELPVVLSSLADGENDYIALADLGSEGYGQLDRQDGTDFNHCAMILRVIGKFHALSFAIKDQKPELFEQLANSVEETYYAEKYRDWYSDFLGTLRIIAMDAMRKECPDKSYVDKAEIFLGPTLLTTLINCTHAKSPYSVISHGDGWAPNFLVKYDGKIPKESKMIDYQLARCSSPALDISFFIYSCTTKELRQQHFDDLLKVYHDSLTDLLRDLGSDPDKVFPYSALLGELKKFGRFGVGMCIESITFSVLDSSECPDLDTIKGDEKIPLTDIWIVHPIKNQAGRQRLADAVCDGIDRGFIDA